MAVLDWTSNISSKMRAEKETVQVSESKIYKKSYLWQKN